MVSPREHTRYTFADYLAWDEGERIEIIDGEAFMTAAPSRIHQEICFEIGRLLGNYLEGKQCRVYPLPSEPSCLNRRGRGRQTWTRWLNLIFPLFVTGANWIDRAVRERRT